MTSGLVDWRGWDKIGPDPTIAAWAKAARPVAEAILATTDEAWRSGGTWFVGVDALPNATDGRLNGAAFPWQALGLTPVPLHKAQLSTVRPGYPQPSAEEGAAAFRYRQQRDAAHLDGLLPIGPDRRRMIREPHAWIVGIPLNPSEEGASPLVLWEGSHKIMQMALADRLAGYPAEDWADVDITDVYQAARKEVFKTCSRVVLSAQPGEATLLHRLTLHGVAPWQDGAEAEDVGRMIAYFRPQLASVAQWITGP